MVCQAYLDDPLLIDNKKFDMRLYVMLKGIDPQPQLYLYNEGMARFCTEDYQKPDGGNLKDLYSHLTNFTLNKDNDKYVNKEDFMEEDSGTKRLVSNVLKQLERDYDCGIEELWEKIEEVVVKSFLVIMPYLRNQFHIELGPIHLSNSNCF